jgi:amino-acid N-acetyltransferase
LPLCHDLPDDAVIAAPSPAEPTDRARSAVRLRPGTPADAETLHALIAAHQTEGHLLPRHVAEIARRAARFTVAEHDGAIVGCAELAPLSDQLAEIRSLVVSPAVRHAGVATRLVTDVRRRAHAAGFDTLCAFAHDARFFIRQNFSIVPHVWLPEKIARDCAGCPRFRRCAQFAMVLPIREVLRYGTDDVPHHAVAVA